MHKMMYTLKGCWDHENLGKQVVPIAVFDSRDQAERYFVESQRLSTRRGENPFVEKSLLYGFSFAVIAPVPVPDPTLPKNPLVGGINEDDDIIQAIFEEF